MRYRKSNCKPKTKGSDDFDRNRRQNEVLHALVDQAKSLNGVLGAGNVIKAVGKNMTTDIENDQMKNMISAYWDISKENINFVPVTGEWRSPYVYINKKELTAAKQALQDELNGVKAQSSTDNDSASSQK
ncbi:putative transcriptional regulator YwtF [compost metagenome]